MTPKKVLLLYISEHSGHHSASIAVENALRSLDPGIETLNINSFNYTNPILEKIINRTYMSVIKRKPEIWDYLYDNPEVMRKAQKLREMIHSFNNAKLKILLDEFSPDAIVCTQAFPCGMVADYKKTFGVDTPLFGILTDYAPHSYWIYDSIDRYIVPAEETGQRLINNGVEPSRIAAFGIPIEKRFGAALDPARIKAKLGLNPALPAVLIMGGTQGLGPIKELVMSIERSYLNIQIIIATGTNKRLYKFLMRKSGHFKKKTLIFPFAENIDELMAVSTVIITKPGGITTAEALAKGTPMLIVNPLPGQEAMNTLYLLKEGAAVKAERPEDVTVLLSELLYNKNKLNIMSERARAISKPNSSLDTAKLVLESVK